MTLTPGQRAPARPRLRPPAGRLRRTRHRGQALVEFALIVPVLLFVLVIAIDFGRLFFSYIQISNAAREGASFGAANPTLTSTIEDHVRQETNSQGQAGESALVIAITCADPAGASMACAAAPGGSGIGNTLTVGVEERFSFLTPLINGFFNNDLRMRAAATGVVLGLAASGGNPGTSCTTPPTIASFTVSVSGRDVSVDASASRPDTGTCAIAGYDWTWGVSPEPFPPITGKTATWSYAADGTYTIELTVSNAAGSLTSTQTVNVISGGPTPTPVPTPTPTPVPTPTPIATPTPSPTPACAMSADFAYSIENGKRVTFTGSYTGAPVPLTWSWTFGSGSNPGTAAVQNPPQVHYTGNGNRTVTLTITNGSCSDAETKVINP